MLIASLIILILVIYILYIFNKLTKYKNNVEEAFSTMDVYLKKRWDLIPQLVETVKGYAKHENATLVEVSKLAENFYDNMSSTDKIIANTEMYNKIEKLVAIAENYPELKANTNYLSLMDKLASTESEIAQARKYYNAVVKDYNNIVEMIPSNIIASLFRFKKRNMFYIAEEEKKAVEVGL